MCQNLKKNIHFKIIEVDQMQSETRGGSKRGEKVNSGHTIVWWRQRVSKE